MSRYSDLIIQTVQRTYPKQWIIGQKLDTKTNKFKSKKK